MGGMAAQIPIKDDPAANDAAHGEGARRQAARGARRPRRHLGRASGPGRRSRARRSTRVMTGAEPARRAARRRARHAPPTCSQVPEGAITEAGLRHNIRVGVQYLEAWLRGIGCVPLYNLMEDAATAEISRAQVWQWLRHGARTRRRPRGRRGAGSTQLLREELQAIARRDRAASATPAGRFDARRRTVRRHDRASADFDEFLTLPAYDRLGVTPHRRRQLSTP